MEKPTVLPPIADYPTVTDYIDGTYTEFLDICKRMNIGQASRILTVWTDMAKLTFEERAASSRSKKECAK